MESKHDSSVLCVHPNQAWILGDREGDLVLALELTKLHGSREQDVATSS